MLFTGVEVDEDGDGEEATLLLASLLFPPAVVESVGGLQLEYL